MAVTNFIPTIWSARLNESFKKNLVYGNVKLEAFEGSGLLYFVNEIN
ncbi:hypothetical protein SAMN03159341_14020 [Paenibacillus sp. 1_12]|nr:hypothetical protein [Paenibacillus sp. 1_12]SFM50794.1 hypothetical protein SAMN03159341_14020 [Paenibacillus sp. 1_12]